MLKRKRETGIIEKFMDLFDLPDLSVKRLALTFGIPFMYISDLDTVEERVKFVSQLLQHRLGFKVSNDQVVINVNDNHEKLINKKLNNTSIYIMPLDGKTASKLVKSRRKE